MSSSYEDLRNKNIADNKRILAELGILNPFRPLPRVQVKKNWKRKRADDDYVPEKKKQKYTPSPAVHPDLLGADFSSGRRRSSRIRGDAAPDIQEIEEEVDEKNAELEKERQRRKSLHDRPMFYGAVDDVCVGTWWQTRIECNHANIHRPTVAGIHPGPEGAYSIALSGGYEDDIDMGDCFTYTGEGGRDLKGTAAKPKNLRTAPQSKDQCLSRGNAALVNSVETKNPVRVLRGYKSPSDFAPEDGYRYDGLYRVEKYWYTVGLSGFGVYKFALKRIEDQAPPPWELMDVQNNNMPAREEKIAVGLTGPEETSKDLDTDSQDSGLGAQDLKTSSSTAHTEPQTGEVTDENLKSDEKSSNSSLEVEASSVATSEHAAELVAETPSSDEKKSSPVKESSLKTDSSKTEEVSSGVSDKSTVDKVESSSTQNEVSEMPVEKTQNSVETSENVKETQCEKSSSQVENAPTPVEKSPSHVEKSEVEKSPSKIEKSEPSVMSQVEEVASEKENIETKDSSGNKSSDSEDSDNNNKKNSSRKEISKTGTPKANKRDQNARKLSGDIRNFFKFK